MNVLIVIALSVLSSPTHAETLGRLFFTPEQRSQIDAQHSDRHHVTLTVNGIVQKNHGARTIWINGVAQSSVVAQREPASVTLSLPDTAHPITLKVGEQIPIVPDSR